MAILASLLAIGAVAGCGADDEPSAENLPDAPDLTVPRTEPTESEPVETQPPPTETAPPVTEETPPPETTTTPPDTPTSDAPPPPDSPAERFEDFCNENPGACG